MDGILLEKYMLLYFDTLVANIVFTFKGELVNSSMISFKIYNRYFIILISAVAATSAGVINYIFGKILYNIWKANVLELSTHNYLALKKILHLYPISISLNVIPIINKIVMTAAGFVNLNFKATMVIIFISRIIYYSIIL